MGEKKATENKETETNLSESASMSSNIERQGGSDSPKYGMTSVCGRRRDMEDTMSIYPSFLQDKHEKSSNLHFFGLYTATAALIDGLWDAVSNETACGVARMFLRSGRAAGSSTNDVTPTAAGQSSSDQACTDASILLTRLALARHSSDNVSVIVLNLKRGL
ncbi:putative protein phosphatase 2C 24 [Capsicum chinense]|nr:putative protein phosphatase 2C 24 [Capsicum chinense]PHU21864.1 putative protein phosphatase 2C 24 [Capsicum chinense]